MKSSASGSDQQYFCRIKHSKDIFAKKALQWGMVNSPEYPWRKTKDPLLTLVAEMLLRKTRAAQVVNVYNRFVATFPTLEILSKSEIKQIHKIVKSLGLNSRSRWIKIIASELNHKFGSAITSADSDLQSVLAKRPYLLYAVQCFSFEKDVAVFDVNVKRILERVFSIQFGNNAHKERHAWEVANMLVPKGKSRIYNL